MNDLTVVIPTLNEENNIGELIKKILNINNSINILVCDDGSIDKTKNIVLSFTENVKFIDRKNFKNKGLTDSVITGIQSSQTEYLIVMDGDMQHPPEIIFEIYQSLKKGSDLVLGVRKNRRAGLKNENRIMLSDVGTFMARYFLYLKRLSVEDPLTGFFGIKKSLFVNLNKKKFVSGGYKILFDILKQIPKSTEIDEIFFNFDFRNDGFSKMKFKHMLLFLFSFLK